MALDYLSIPVSIMYYALMIITNIPYSVTSTSVKCMFLQGHHFLSFTHNKLSPSSIKAFLYFGSWSYCGLIVFNDVVVAVSAKSR
jgi:16S rRNA A1518/A1519 N6-dimethyltransferase RsmA/KsgA/DIM1 with predicted DNA glycosylase/AP lyase activity